MELPVVLLISWCLFLHTVHSARIDDKLTEMGWDYSPTARIAVDGGWGDWKLFSECSTECLYEYYRKCDNPVPFDGGKPCSGENTETAACTGGKCKRGKLEYKENTDYEMIWNEQGTGGKYFVSIWRQTNLANGYCSLGDVATNNMEEAMPKFYSISVPVPKDSDYTIHPLGFKHVWADHGADGFYHVEVYRMVPPANFTCLGSVAMDSYENPPKTTDYCCIRNDFLEEGIPRWLYWDTDTGATEELSLWMVEPSHSTGLPGHNFDAVNGYNEQQYKKVITLAKAILV